MGFEQNCPLSIGISPMTNDIKTLNRVKPDTDCATARQLLPPWRAKISVVNLTCELQQESSICVIMWWNFEFVIDHVALSKQGDNVLGSVHPSVHLSECALARSSRYWKLSFAECNKEQ